LIKGSFQQKLEALLPEDIQVEAIHAEEPVKGAGAVV
jgi:hypothetical protein